jgi:hypothetical protein
LKAYWRRDRVKPVRAAELLQHARVLRIAEKSAVEGQSTQEPRGRVSARATIVVENSRFHCWHAGVGMGSENMNGTITPRAATLTMRFPAAPLRTDRLPYDYQPALWPAVLAGSVVAKHRARARR